MTTQHGNEDGLGLLELIVSVVISGIVLVAVGTMFVNSLKTQERVLSVSEATNRGQLVSSTVERAIRNALYFDVTDGNTVLRVRTSLEGGLKCQGFRITDAAAQFSAHGVTLSSPSTGWPTWQTGITRQGTTPYFVRTAAGSLTYALNITTDGAPVKFSADIAPRSLQEAGSDGCW